MDRGRQPPLWTSRELIADNANDVYFSVASGWEIVVKAGLRRVELPDDPDRFIPEQVSANAFQVLPVHLRHALKIYTLSDLHRDPFDRMLVAQAVSEEMVLLSGDPQIARYPVEVVW